MVDDQNRPSIHANLATATERLLNEVDCFVPIADTYLKMGKKIAKGCESKQGTAGAELHTVVRENRHENAPSRDESTG
ncbi:hypothetical protein GCM10023155_03030 [Bremerella cremea]